MTTLERKISLRVGGVQFHFGELYEKEQWKMDAELYCFSFYFESNIIQKTRHSHYFLFTNINNVFMDLSSSKKS